MQDDDFEEFESSESEFERELFGDAPEHLEAPARFPGEPLEAAQGDPPLEAAPPELAPPPPPPGPPEPVPPPPAPPVAHAARVGRVRRGVPWGPFSLAPVFSARRGQAELVQTGWGANCHCHKDTGSSTRCQRNLTYGGTREELLSDLECQRQLKRWLLRGLEVDRAADNARHQHMSIPVRGLGPATDPEDLDVPPVEHPDGTITYPHAFRPKDW